MQEVKEKKRITTQTSATEVNSEPELLSPNQADYGESDRKKLISSFFTPISTGILSAGILAAFGLIGIVGYNLNYLKGGTSVANSSSVKKIGDTESNSDEVKTAGAVSKTILPDGTEIAFSYIPAGSFELGSTEYDNENPIHNVKLSQNFWMGQTEISQKQWKSLMGTLPTECDYGQLKGDFLGDKKPIICVSWDDAQNFVSKLNELNDGYKYRLPTEAEWEYAARSGNTENFVANADTVAWYGRNSSGYIHNVGLVKPNAWNLYDMHGNVREWCQDWYGGYPDETVTDPTGAESGSAKVIRGSWFASLTLRSGARSSDSPTTRNHNLGFRVIRQ